MLTADYRHEMSLLLAKAQEFGEAHPELAPWLGARGADPDVERLLEGVAYLAATIQGQLSEGFPELAESLLDILFPQLSYALPAMTLIRFLPAPGFSEAIFAPKGSMVASIPLNSARAQFAVTTDVPIWPAHISGARLVSSPGSPGVLELKVSAIAPLGSFLQDSLAIHLAGDLGEAANRRDLLLNNVKAVEIVSGSLNLTYGPEAISPYGLEPEGSVGASAALGYGLIREYFAFPEKFLFVRLNGLGPLKNSRENGFAVRCYLKNPLKRPLAVKAEYFLLNVAPAVNLFNRSAHPVNLDHRQEEYLIRPQKSEGEKLAIQRVAKVTGVTSSGQERVYQPFTGFGLPDNRGRYATHRLGEGLEDGAMYLKVIYPQSLTPPEPETLSVELRCHNLGLTDFLRAGDISQPTERSPAMAVFGNISAPSKVCPPPSAEGVRWRILSHLHLSLGPLTRAASLRDLLALYAPPDDPDPARKAGVLNRIGSITNLTAETMEAFVRGWPIRGRKLSLAVDGSKFASPGEIGLFGDVLERFLAGFLPLNSGLSLSILDTNSQEARSWPIRLGSKRVL
ncbi:MAG: type VI secretion system baseplate subunit TssF [Deltaproteobacteria bacterium]|jgi:type VI secretion system protein ImpG|nr:type VI secretion system baseplate subunit TssF [Deltaproteobacteria bacterium]